MSAATYLVRADVRDAHRPDDSVIDQVAQLTDRGGVRHFVSGLWSWKRSIDSTRSLAADSRLPCALPDVLGSSIHRNHSTGPADMADLRRHEHVRRRHGAVVKSLRDESLVVAALLGRVVVRG
jgi:hypothetical protein